MLDDAHEFSSHEVTSKPRLIIKVPGLPVTAFSDLLSGDVGMFRFRCVRLPECAFRLVGKVRTVPVGVAASIFREVD